VARLLSDEDSRSMYSPAMINYAGTGSIGLQSKLNFLGRQIGIRLEAPAIDGTEVPYKAVLTLLRQICFSGVYMVRLIADIRNSIACCFKRSGTCFFQYDGESLRFKTMPELVMCNVCTDSAVPNNNMYRITCTEMVSILTDRPLAKYDNV